MLFQEMGIKTVAVSSVFAASRAARSMFISVNISMSWNPVKT